MPNFSYFYRVKCLIERLLASQEDLLHGVFFLIKIVQKCLSIVFMPHPRLSKFYKPICITHSNQSLSILKFCPRWLILHPGTFPKTDFTCSVVSHGASLATNL
jgi:hypothetical protein